MTSLSDLSKLTVPQLKALCKERRITGYSRLSKAALLQRLAEITVPSAPTRSASTVPSNDQAGQTTKVVPSITSAHEVQNPVRSIESPHQQAVSSIAAGNTDTTIRSANPTPGVSPSEPRKTTTVTNSTGTQETSRTKRQAHIDTSTPPKRIKTSLQSTTNAEHEPPAQRTSTPQRTAPANHSSVFKVPELPKRMVQTISTPAKQPCGARKRPDVPRTITSGLGRFKPLPISKSKPVRPDQKNEEPPQISCIDALPRVADSHATSPPVLSHISLPPKVSERKCVYRWAIILSALSEPERRVCRLVSRTFRYAIYLSAGNVLSRDFSGRRLDAVLEQHARNMTNLWPYLRFRTTEVSERRRAFHETFLGQYMLSMGRDPLTKHLWTSPDDEKQVSVALRFVLTRMWFAISVGSYGHDASSWSTCVVWDVREVVRGQVWQVMTRNDDSGESGNFYVLEATCEVIGQPPGHDTLGYCLRADWTAWVSQRSQAPESDNRPGSLLESVKWSNTEDYYRGISKVWMRRVQGQDPVNVAKRDVAERYILASVVANGISGKWMSTSAMAQEFAGLTSRDYTGTRNVARNANTVNIYLPDHHHIESIHFTTSKGAILHAAVAVVQTIGREYYVLKDNGMQIGCEEEGVAWIWQQILKCNVLGEIDNS